MFTKFGNNDNRGVFTNVLVRSFVNTRVKMTFAKGVGYITFYWFGDY